MRRALLSAGTIVVVAGAETALVAIFSCVPPSWVATIFLSGAVVGVISLAATLFWEER